MAEDKPLIAGEQAPTPFLTAGAVGPLVTVGKDLTDGDWAEGLVNSAFAGSSAITAVADPLAALGTAGAAWAIEYFDFLREPLDAVAGDQQAIEAMSATWANIGQEVKGAADDLNNAVKRDTGSWSGEAADAYRESAHDKASTFAGIADACTAAGTAVQMCGTLLNVARGIIRDLISQAVGELVAAIVEWAAAQCVSVGLASPAMIADLTRRALKWANKISEWTKRATSAFQNLFQRLGRFGDALKKVKEFLEKPFTLGQSPLGTSATLKRAEPRNINSIKMDGDIPTAAGNKVVGAGRLEAAKAVQGDTFPSASDPNPDPDKRPTGNQDHYQ